MKPAEAASQSKDIHTMDELKISSNKRLKKSNSNMVLKDEESQEKNRIILLG
jgi:hypothetical protein